MDVIIITGSSRGIGYCLSNYLKNKYRIVIHGKSQKTIDEAKKKLGINDNIIYIKSDILDYKYLIDETIKHYGKIDILVNNCAICKSDDEHDIININTMIPYKLSEYSIKHGVKKIINISANCYSVVNNMIDYQLSKNMLENITKYMAYKYYKKCIISCLRIDDAFKTDMTKFIYSEDIFSKLKDPNNLIPLFLTLLKMGDESSGKIYSYNRSKTNLYLETTYNNNYIMKQNLHFPSCDDCIHLSNGENKFAYEIGKYPTDKKQCDLEEKLSKYIGINKDNIVLNNGGISQSFDMFCDHFINNGDEIITSSLSFSLMFKSITNRGGVIKYINTKIENNKFNYNLDKIIDLISPITKIIYLTHPTYILGDVFDKDYFINILKKIPKNILIIIDECYIDFYNNIINSYDLINDYFVVGLRTFSKLHGLASLRLGYIICNNKIKNIIKQNQLFKSIPSNSMDILDKYIDNNNHNDIKKKYLKEKLYLTTEFKKLNIKIICNTFYVVIFLPKKIDKKKILKILENNKIIIPDYNFINNTIIYTIDNRNINNKLINIFKNYK